MNHQIMCVFSGKKEWIFWNMQTEEKKIPMWNQYYKHPKKGKSQGSDDSPIDGERVDLLRWPEFAKAKWSNTTIEKGDCLFTPANLLHYVRSWGDGPESRNFALMTMYQTEEVYDPTHCIDPPAYVPMSDYDTSWGEFPGSMEVPRCMNHIKMGYPNYKKTTLQKLAAREVDKAGFVQYFKAGAQQTGYAKKRIAAAWEKFSKEGNVGSWAEKIFNSTAVLQLARDMACASQGHSGPERKLKEGESWDSRNEFSLAGGTKGKTDETHAEL